MGTKCLQQESYTNKMVWCYVWGYETTARYEKCNNIHVLLL